MRLTERAVRYGVVVVAWLVLAPFAYADSVTLLWDPSPDPVLGYIVHAGTQSGVYTVKYDVGNTTSAVFANAVPGQRYYFAVAAYTTNSAVSPLADEISWVSDPPPVLQNPGDQTSMVGESVALQLVGSDPGGQSVSYAATGLPPGVDLAATGLLQGAPTTAGSYVVTASVSDGAASASVSFNWTVSALDRTAPVVTITSPAPKPSENYTTPGSSVTIAGLASDAGPVVSVRWSNGATGAAGAAVGTNSWSAVIPLAVGRNDLEISATDQAGNTGTETISVRRRR